MRSHAEAKLWDADGHHNSSTKRLSGAQLATNLNFDFPQVVRQHTLGVVGYLVWVSFTIYSCFRRWKNFENQLGFDKVIISVGCRGPLFGTQCRWNLTGCRRQVHTWPNFGEKKIFTKILYSPGFLGYYLKWPRCLTFDPKNWSAHRRTQIHLWPKLREIPFIGVLGSEIWCLQGFLVIACCNLNV